MMRDFNIADLAAFEPNAVSSPDDIMHVFEDDAWWLYTLENNGIKAIIVFRDTGNDEWAAFTLISKHFNMKDTIEMRAFIDRARAVLKPSKLWTLSPPSPKVDKWHRFFGFIFDSPQTLQGKLFNKWVMT